jgi:hypothetical protein
MLGAIVENGLEIGAGWIDDVGAVVARVVLRPLARRSVVQPADCDRGSVERIDSPLVADADREVEAPVGRPSTKVTLPFSETRPKRSPRLRGSLGQRWTRLPKPGIEAVVTRHERCHAYSVAP